uniref:Ig-like domain-containing protein n=1 Tax=Cyprinus carpio TaxID=7962 RepID=A0A8C1NFW2_CYPCA
MWCIEIKQTLLTFSLSHIQPKPVVRVQPDGRVFRGQTVTLTCDIQDTDVTNWSYSWNKDDSEIHVSQSQEYRISSVSESHTGNYRCTGRETGGSRYSHTSDKVTLTVSGEWRPKAAVMINENDESLTVRCEIPGPEDDWTYSWFIEGSSLPFSSDREFSIRTGVSDTSSNITCRGQRESDGQMSEISGAVTLTVSRESDELHCIYIMIKRTITCLEGLLFTLKKRGVYKVTLLFSSCSAFNPSKAPKARLTPVVRVQPDGRVFRGQTVTLTCDIQDTNVTNWSYIWNKDDSEIHVSQSQEYRISSVSESHTGNYSCTGRETGGSRYSHTSDKVTLTVSGESHALITGVIAGLSVTFLLIFFLALLWCCKHNKGLSHLFKSA